MTINLQTDADGNIISTAQDVARAVNEYHFNHPNALVTANLPNYPDGGGVVEEMAPTRLTGGDDDIEIDNYGAKIRFESDGSALKVGDRYEIDVSYYHGDGEDIEVNSNFNTRVKINVTGEEALGGVGADDNILDRLSRLKFALESHDSVAVAGPVARDQRRPGQADFGNGPGRRSYGPQPVYLQCPGLQRIQFLRKNVRSGGPGHRRRHRQPANQTNRLPGQPGFHFHDHQIVPGRLHQLSPPGEFFPPVHRRIRPLSGLIPFFRSRKQELCLPGSWGAPALVVAPGVKPDPGL